MNKSLAILTLLLLLSNLLYCQQVEEEKLDQIRHWYEEVNVRLDQCRKVELPDINVYQDTRPTAYSREGAEIYRLAVVSMTKYYDGNELKKAVVTFNGDREELISEYYFRADSLFFVDKFKTIYHRPKWHDEFEATEKSILKNRFYFHDTHLLKWVKWIDTEVRPISKKDPVFAQQESSVLQDAMLYAYLE